MPACAYLLFHGDLTCLYETFISTSQAGDKDLQPMTSTELSHLSVKTFGHAQWNANAAPDVLRHAAPALENGDVVFLPHILFEVSSRELQFFSPRIVGSSKNIGFDPATGQIGGSVLVDADER